MGKWKCGAKKMDTTQFVLEDIIVRREAVLEWNQAKQKFIDKGEKQWFVRVVPYPPILQGGCIGIFDSKDEASRHRGRILREYGTVRGVHEFLGRTWRKVHEELWGPKWGSK